MISKKWKAGSIYRKSAPLHGARFPVHLIYDKFCMVLHARKNPYPGRYVLDR